MKRHHTDSALDLPAAAAAALEVTMLIGQVNTRLAAALDSCARLAAEREEQERNGQRLAEEVCVAALAEKEGARG